MEIDLNDVTLFYRTEGLGDPALVMHGGLGADHTAFVNSGFNKLSKQLKLIYYDHRCNGRSSFPGVETLTHKNLATDAENLRIALGHKNLTVIGHSYVCFTLPVKFTKVNINNDDTIWNRPGGSAKNC